MMATMSGKLPGSIPQDDQLNIHSRDALIYYCENCGEWSEDGVAAVKCVCGKEAIQIEVMSLCSVPLKFEFVPEKPA